MKLTIKTAHYVWRRGVFIFTIECKGNTNGGNVDLENIIYTNKAHILCQ